MPSPLVFALCAILAAAPLQAATVLTFDVVSHTESPKGAKPVTSAPSRPADTHYTLTVALSGDTLQLDEPDTQTQFDFKNARIDRLNKLEKTYDEGSLYTVVGFNVVEFANRMALGAALTAGKVKDNPMALPLTENLMSLSDPGSTTVIDHSTQSDETVYTWKGQRLMAVSRKTRELPDAVFPQYMRFLRYSTGGHPQILAAIERGHGIPERLTIVRANVGIETRMLTLQSIEERPDALFSAAGYVRHTPDGEPFTTLKKVSASSAAADLEAHAAVLRQERDAAATEHRIFDAMLANFAAMLSTGDQTEATAWISAHRDQLHDDADSQSLFRSLSPRDAASATVAADTLAKMRQSAGPHRYVLNIFEANTRFALHQVDQAIDLFLAALAADPTITGAWVDLGNMYYTSFRADAAWACWDAARSLRPQHYLVKQVDDLERKLRADHPEFF